MLTRSRLHLVLLGIASIAIVACGPSATATPRPTASASPPGSSTGPAGSPSTPPSPAASTSGQVPKAWLLVGRAGQPRLELVMAETGEVQEMTVPDGAPADLWHRVVTATPDGSSTIVRDEIVQPGNGGPELSLTGTWSLPTVGLDPLPVGRSLDGSTIVLVEPSDATPGRSRFAIVEHRQKEAVQTSGDAPLQLARIVDLTGDFDYDALSPNGRILYVVQHLDAAAGGHYQVRAIDVPTGVMREAVIVDKGDADAYMAGSPLAQLRRADGLVLTLYRGPDHPFIHALNSIEAWAICIDLPAASAAAGSELSARADWGLSETASGSSVYAVNASLGLAVEVDPRELAVRRSASISMTASGPSIVLAKFGHGDVGPTGRRLVTSPDGAMLFAASGTGLTAIRTQDLSAVRTIPLGPVEAVGITPDGATVFALTRDGTIAAVDAATGSVLGTVPGSGYDRLLAVAPW
ncbi:MAG TPA: hypothetical protein VGJ71_04960 [Candidatus Limnocylindrales bacterium]